MQFNLKKNHRKGGPKSAQAAPASQPTLKFRLMNCNQSEVAKSIGYDQSQVSRAVNGKLTPSRDFGQALASYFKCSLDEILAAVAAIQKAKMDGKKGKVLRPDDKRLGARFKKPKTVEIKKGKK